MNKNKKQKKPKQILSLGDILKRLLCVHFTKI